MEQLYEIIAWCKKKNIAAQQQLYKMYAPRLRAVCRRYIVDVDDSQDVLHDSFIKIFDKIDQCKDTKTFEAWMRRIVVNTALQFYKKKKKTEVERLDDINESRIIDSEDKDGDSVFDMVKQADFTVEELLELINRNLNDESRIIFNLFYVENYSHKEISEMLQIDYSTCRSKLSRAKIKLQEVIITVCNTKVSV